MILISFLNFLKKGKTKLFYLFSLLIISNVFANYVSGIFIIVSISIGVEVIKFIQISFFKLLLGFVIYFFSLYHWAIAINFGLIAISCHLLLYFILTYIIIIILKPTNNRAKILLSLVTVEFIMLNIPVDYNIFTINTFILDLRFHQIIIQKLHTMVILSIFLISVTSLNYFMFKYKLNLWFKLSIVATLFFLLNVNPNTAFVNWNDGSELKNGQQYFLYRDIEGQNKRIYHFNNYLENNIQSVTLKNIEFFIGPELSITGLHLEKDRLEIARLKENLKNLNIKQMCIGVSYIDNKKLYNGSLTYNDGLIEFHQKNKLIPILEYSPIFFYSQYLFEAKKFEKGNFSPRKLVHLICYEAFFSDFFTNFSFDKGDTVFVISSEHFLNSSQKGFDYYNRHLRLRAIENSINIMKVSTDFTNILVTQNGKYYPLPNNTSFSMENF